MGPLDHLTFRYTVKEKNSNIGTWVLLVLLQGSDKIFGGSSCS